MVIGVALHIRLTVALATVCLSACLFHSASAASLYNEAEFRPLAADQRARRVGDLITVLVVENSSAASTANTSAGRDANFGFDLQAPFGGRGGSVKLNNQTEGRGQTIRQGKVVASITVVVREVAGNGDLLIAGEQMVEVNNERQQIKVEGRIRPQDIAESNTVSSTRLADARISYVGEGDIADRQRPGLWQRALTWLGL
jgi:flagellar L-ring protein precursor FlgH